MVDEILPHFINIWDIVTNLVPLYLVFQEPSDESNFTLLAQVSTELPDLSMLFILELVSCATAMQLKNK